jgi:hypothetical protein
MSAGTGASNLGYGNKPIFNASPYVNGGSFTYAGSFSSNEIPTSCMKGGKSKSIKSKIKNITKLYKTMKGKSKSRKIKQMKKRIRSKMMKRSKMLKRRTRRTRRNYRGGYSQYQNNLPMTPTYQVAGIQLPSSQLGLANPPPITNLSNCTNCVDNYNAYTNTGFPSKGH